MVARVLRDVHKFWYYRVLFLPMAVFAAILLLAKMAESLFAIGLISSFIVMAFTSSGASNVFFTGEYVFYLWFDIAVISYLILLVHRSVRVIFKKTFYAVKDNVEIYLSFDRLSKATTGYMIFVGILYILLPERG